MKALRAVILIWIIACFFVAAGRCQSRVSENRSSLEFSAGIWTGKEALQMPTPVGFIHSNHAGGPLEAEISYTHPLVKKFALTANVGLLAAQSTSFIDPVGLFPDFHQTTVVVPILVGIRYFLPPVEQLSRATPYLSAALGVNLGYQTSRLLYDGYIGAQKFAFAPAGRLGTGLDYHFNNHVYLTLKVDYFVMTDFPVTVGERAGYDGLQLLLGTGMVF
jgi:hypothetical protein